MLKISTKSMHRVLVWEIGPANKADFGRAGISQPAKEYEEKLLDVRTNQRVINTKVKEGNDLLTLYGRQMCIK